MSKEEIWDCFWANIEEEDKPVVLEMFYSDMTDSQKDKFLEMAGMQ